MVQRTCDQVHMYRVTYRVTVCITVGSKVGSYSSHLVLVVYMHPGSSYVEHMDY